MASPKGIWGMVRGAGSKLAGSTKELQAISKVGGLQIHKRHIPSSHPSAKNRPQKIWHAKQDVKKAVGGVPKSPGSSSMSMPGQPAKPTPFKHTTPAQVAKAETALYGRPTSTEGIRAAKDSVAKVQADQRAARDKLAKAKSGSYDPRAVGLEAKAHQDRLTALGVDSFGRPLAKGVPTPDERFRRAQEKRKFADDRAIETAHDARGAQRLRELEADNAKIIAARDREIAANRAKDAATDRLVKETRAEALAASQARVAETKAKTLKIKTQLADQKRIDKLEVDRRVALAKQRAGIPGSARSAKPGGVKALVEGGMTADAYRNRERMIRAELAAETRLLGHHGPAEKQKALQRKVDEINKKHGTKYGIQGDLGSESRIEIHDTSDSKHAGFGPVFEHDHVSTAAKGVPTPDERFRRAQEKRKFADDRAGVKALVEGWETQSPTSKVTGKPLPIRSEAEMRQRELAASRIEKAGVGPGRPAPQRDASGRVIPDSGIHGPGGLAPSKSAVHSAAPIQSEAADPRLRSAEAKSKAAQNAYNNESQKTFPNPEVEERLRKADIAAERELDRAREKYGSPTDQSPQAAASAEKIKKLTTRHATLRVDPTHKSMTEGEGIYSSGPWGERGPQHRLTYTPPPTPLKSGGHRVGIPMTIGSKSNIATDRTKGLGDYARQQADKASQAAYDLSKKIQPTATRLKSSGAAAQAHETAAINYERLGDKTRAAEHKKKAKEFGAQHKELKKIPEHEHTHIDTVDDYEHSGDTDSQAERLEHQGAKVVNRYDERDDDGHRYGAVEYKLPKGVTKEQFHTSQDMEYLEQGADDQLRWWKPTGDPKAKAHYQEAKKLAEEVRRAIKSGNGREAVKLSAKAEAAKKNGDAIVHAAPLKAATAEAKLMGERAMKEGGRSHQTAQMAYQDAAQQARHAGNKALESEYSLQAKKHGDLFFKSRE